MSHQLGFVAVVAENSHYVAEEKINVILCSC